MLSRRINVLDVVFDGLQVAGFQVSITGRFCVSTEASSPPATLLQDLVYRIGAVLQMGLSKCRFGTAPRS